MAVITTRETAGTGATVAGVPLTNVQLDTNFINLNSELSQKLPLSGGTLTGNLDFNGVGLRMTANTTGSTVNERFAFVTNQANSATRFNVAPSGTGTASSLNVFNASNLNNSSVGALIVGSTGVTLSSGITGTGTYLPLAISTGGSDRWNFDIYGNIGVDMTPSAWDTNYRAIEFKSGSLWSYNSSSTSILLTQNVLYDGTYKYKNTGFATQYIQTNGTHSWSVASSDTAGNPISWIDAVTITALGRTGFGTNNPQGKLHVSGGDLVLFSGVSGNSPKLIFGGDYSSTDKSIYLSGGWMTFKAHQNEGFKFITVDAIGTETERFKVTSSGVQVTGTITGSLSGNATTATTLQTARNINGVSFNGSADITITANTTNNLTFNSSGSGTASGATFNGSSAVTLSYNSIGALPSVIASNGKGYVTHDFNSYPNLYDAIFVNPTSSLNLPTGMSSVMSYRFVMGAGDVAARGFDLVGAAESSGNLYIRERSIGTWSRVLHSNNYTSYVNNATLTMNVSGNGLSGSQTFTSNQGTAATFTVTSNATNANTGSTIVFRDASGNFSAGTITAALSGNATTATTLATARNINGVSFNGSADITVADSTKLPLTGGTLTGQLTIGAVGTGNNPTLRINTSSSAAFVHTQENFAANLTAGQTAVKVVGQAGSTKNSGYIGYYWAGAASNSNYVSIGHWGNDHILRIYGDGAVTVGTNTVLHAGNYNSYSPTLTGTGASGTWGINITGSAGSLSSNSSYMVYRGSVADASIDSATSNGFYTRNYTGASASTLVWDAGGSAGTVQIDVMYGNTGPIKLRNKTDNTTWSSWRTFLTDQNYSSYAMPYNGIPSGSDTYVNFRVMRNINATPSDGMYIGYGNANSGVTRLFGGGATGGEFVKYSNYSYEPGSFRAPIFYDSDNTGFYLDPNASTSLNMAGSVRQATYNLAGLISVASGTASTGGSIAVQQETAEGWTGIFCDYEPYTGWGLWHDNPNNYFSFTSEDSTGSIRSFSVPSRSSGNRTAYEKFRVEQATGDVIVGRNGFANTSFRAPIFYDSNDTGYYCDPASTSNLNALTLGGRSTTYAMHYAGFTLDANTMPTNSTGFTYSVNAPCTGPIADFSTGGGYDMQLNANYGNSERLAIRTRQGDGGYWNGWRWVMLENTWINDKYFSSDGIIYSNSSFRAPIFYDSSNTGYYVDPAGSSRLTTIYCGDVYNDLGGWFRSYNTTGLYNQTYGNHWYATSDAYWNLAANNGSVAGIIFRTGGHQGTVRGYVYSDSSNNIGFLNSGGSWRLRVVADDYTLSEGSSIRGQLFYDSNDTDGVIDPVGHSRLKTAGHAATGNVSALEIKNTGGTGDGDVAAISWHCSNYYGLQMHLRHDGYFGIGGWSASSWRWYVNNTNGDMTAAGSVTSYSDPRLKENIEPITSALDRVKQLNGVTFNWKQTSVIGKPGCRDYGILSTDVEKIAPELVVDSVFEAPEGDRYKTVAYDKLTPILIEAIKEQNVILENYKSEVEHLKALVKELLDARNKE